MFDIPIIDSLTHPTIDTNWRMPEYPNRSSIDQLLLQMEANNISQSVCAGMTGIGSYDEEKYIKMIVPHQDKLIPIAFFDLNNKLTISEISDKLNKLKALGYKGIKLHPRISSFNLSHPLLSSVIKQANESQLSVLLCTYFYDKSKNSNSNFLDKLSDLLYDLDGAKILLMHGGTVRLLETIEIVRSYNNVLLDLSFTICKYNGSSLDMDIQFAFDTYDRRICIGSDFPEFSPRDLRERFIFFSNAIPHEKAENIAYRNIAHFLHLI
jgi:predicted TIM-barrel fold metal-dependent hydrolase